MSANKDEVAPSGKDSVKRALAHLNVMQSPPDNPKAVELPFPVIERPKDFALTKNLQRGMQHGTVKLDDLVGTQDYVQRKRVKRLIKAHANADTIPPRIASVVKIRGLWVLYGGHHHATAAKLLGHDHIRANVLDVDGH